MYETKGEFYPNTLQIGQSELLLLALYNLQRVFELKWILALSDLLLVLAQLWIVYESSLENKQTVAAIVCFNPFTIFGQTLINIGTFNNTVYMLIVIAMIHTKIS